MTKDLREAFINHCREAEKFAGVFDNLVAPLLEALKNSPCDFSGDVPDDYNCLNSECSRCEALITFAERVGSNG